MSAEYGSCMVTSLLIDHKAREENASQIDRAKRAWAEKPLLTGFIFTRDDARAMHPDIITDWLSKFSKVNNLPHIHSHTLSER